MKYRLLHFETIDSTNTYLKKLHDDLDHFTFVSSDYQFKGKGRNNRLWHSLSKDNLLMSFLLKEKSYVENSPYLSICTAVEVAKLLERYHFSNVTIKWPNDVYINDKKVCGILLEGQIPQYVVIGIGLNINQKTFPSDLRVPATSLTLEKEDRYEVEVIKKQLIEQLINNLNVDYLEQYLKYFENHNFLLNKKIEVLVDKQKQCGVVVGVDQHFHLLIQNEEQLLHIESGEIRIL